MNITNLKGHLISALITFVSAFILAFFAILSQPAFIFTKAAIFSLLFSSLVTAVRAAAKFLIEWAMSITTNPVSAK